MSAQPAGRVRRPTAAELAAVPAEDEGVAAQREADAEEFDGAVVVPLETDDGIVDITVPPAEEWRDSAIEAMNRGRFGVWAEKTLSAADYEAWADADPRVRQVNAFFAEWGRLTGINSPESRASARSSRGARRR